MEPRKAAIMLALDQFVRQRPGLEFGNYGDIKTYRSEMRSITKDRHHYDWLAARTAAYDGITADDLIKAAESAFSGRLSIKSCPHGDGARTCGEHVWCGDCEPSPSALCPACHGATRNPMRPNEARIDYVAGQYFPTEYRKAACAVLASALWAHVRERCMPEPCNRDQHETSLYSDPFSKTVLSAGDWLRAHFRREFGASIANRWFS